ncbi:MAG: hypothetical protein ACRENU_09440 [Gemmatimonadaceae bacterium]
MARQRRVRFIARVSVGALGVVGLIALIAGAWDVMAANWRSEPQVSQAGGDAGRVELATQARPRPPATPVTKEAAPTVAPIIAEGRRELGDSMYAVRSGADVTVFFDTELLRTRLDWKFEGVVRATLPLVFGTGVQPALDSIPTGTMARGDLLYDLPTRGIAIRLSNATLKVWPVTRPGRDGPIIVAYRAQASR